MGKLIMAALAAAACVLVAGPVAADDRTYQAAVEQWTSHKNVATWLEQNFRFDEARLQAAQEGLRSRGPQGLPARNPASLFEAKSGYCVDSANLARDALNRIDPAHDAKWIFIKNGAGQPNHWVTGYMVDGRLYVMDYGAGPHWAEMKGVHGPYDTLDDYKAYLGSLSVKGFSPASVEWRRTFPGRED